MLANPYCHCSIEYEGDIQYIIDAVKKPLAAAGIKVTCGTGEAPDEANGR